MRRLLIVFAICVVLVIGVVAAVVIHRLQGEGNIRGSSTEEFVPTTAAPKPPPLGIPWPQYGFDETRDRAVQLSLRPPYRKIWWFGAGSLVEFPPAIGYGRLYFSTNSGKFAHYATPNTGYAVLYGSMADCVESAVSGKPVFGAAP